MSRTRHFFASYKLFGAVQRDRTDIVCLEGRGTTIIRVQHLAGKTGFEPAVFSVTGRHVRPLHHMPNSVVGTAGIEPATPALSALCSTD